MPHNPNCCNDKVVPSELFVLVGINYRGTQCLFALFSIQWNGNGWTGSIGSVNVTVDCQASGGKLSWDLGCDSGSQDNACDCSSLFCQYHGSVLPTLFS